MNEGKKYEVIIGRDVEYNAKKPILDSKSPINSVEAYLESILNEYADKGYKVAGVWKEVIIMERIK